MAIVSDRMSANKPPPGPAVDPKTGKLAPGTLNNGRDLDSDLKQKEEGFFGSFWPGGRKQQQLSQKKGAAAMEAVSPNQPTFFSQNGAEEVLIARVSLQQTFVLRELCQSVKRWRRKLLNF